MSKQTTLMQSWRGAAKGAKKKKSPAVEEIIHLDDDEDDDDILLARAMEQSLKEPQPSTSAQSCNVTNKPTGLFHQIGKTCTESAGLGNVPSESGDANLEFGFEDEDDVDEAALASMMSAPLPPSATPIEDLPGFDKAAGRLWIYPTNYPVREYQFNIVQSALKKNTLVVLPTGLGKTFIAAVVMYNFYRWYPQAKIVFMAPTKPLVAQQIEACYNIMGIPQEHTAEMTGQMSPAERVTSWQKRRVFFLTPQVLTNDLTRAALPAEQVKCLVVDEAHKALGNHAYCQVVRELSNYSQDFRILALSATPGSDLKMVQNVLNNLHISHVELRSEESPDIQQYSHHRQVDKIVVPLGQQLTEKKEQYIQILTVFVGRLKRQGVLYNRDVTSLSKFLVLKARDAFRQDPPQNLQRSQFGAIEGDFAVAMSLYHGLELLELQGLRSLHHFLESTLSGDKGYGRTRTELMKIPAFRDLMDFLAEKYKPSKAMGPSAGPQTVACSQPGVPFDSGHPKMDKLQEIVIEHFKTYQQDGSGDGAATRVMIFAQYRDSVQEITQMLKRHWPLVKVMGFIGQSSNATKGFTQKEQLQVMREFRAGGYNTLVSTCVGEEGLDIGDVDLIVCFDASKSPIRLVQRMGRTGRKRAGRIVMLVTKGKEEQIYNQSQYSKRSIHKALLAGSGGGSSKLHLYPDSPAMIPRGLTPQCHKMHINVSVKFVGVGGKVRAKAGAGRKTSATAAAVTGAGPSGARRSTAKDGFLTEEELQYWSEHFKLDEKEVPLLPESRMLSLKEPPPSTPGKKRAPRLSLNEWGVWQNRLHPSLHSGHSSMTRHFVELMEFVELQNVIGGEEDNYGQEMALYLKEDDVIKPAKTTGIRRFCTPLTTRSKAQRSKVVKRRSDALPTFSSDEETNKSDEDLPPAFQAAKEPSSDATKESTSSEKEPEPSTSKASKRNTIKGASKSKFPSVCLSPPKQPKQSKKGKGKGKKSKVKSPIQANTTGIVSEIEPVREDLDDFEHTSPGLVARVEMEEPMDVIEMNEIDCAGSPMEAEMEADMESEAKENVDPATETTEDPTFAEMFPVFELQQIFPVSNSQKSMESRSSGRKSRSGKVLTPPDEDEMDSQLEALDAKGKMSPVDVLAMIDTWNSVNLSTSQASNSSDQTHRPKTPKSALKDTRRSHSKQSTALQTIQLSSHGSNSVLDTSDGMDHLLVDQGLRSQVHRKALFKRTSGSCEAVQERDKTLNQTTEHEIESEKENSKDRSVPPLENETSFIKASHLNPTSPVTFQAPKFSPSSVLNQSTPIGKAQNRKNNESSSEHESFFQGDDSLFMGIKTPQCQGNDIPKETVTGLDVSVVLRGDKRERDDQRMPSESSRKHNSSAFRTPSPVHKANMTQLTFTQAMDCLQTSLDHNRTVSRLGDTVKTILAKAQTSPAVESSEEDSPIFSSCLPNSGKKLQVPVFDLELDDGLSEEEEELRSSQNWTVNIAKDAAIVKKQNPIEAKNGCDNTRAISPMEQKTIPAVVQIDEPQFDLGFDFDDEFDDDMVIPPSPPQATTQPFPTQKSKLLTEDSVKSQSPGLIGGLFGGRKDSLVTKDLKPNPPGQDGNSSETDDDLDVPLTQIGKKSSKTSVLNPEANGNNAVYMDSSETDEEVDVPLTQIGKKSSKTTVLNPQVNDNNTNDMDLEVSEADDIPLTQNVNRTSVSFTKLKRRESHLEDIDETVDPFAGDDSFWDRGLTGKIAGNLAVEDESQSILDTGEATKFQPGLSRLHSNRQKNGSTFQPVAKLAEKEREKDRTPVAIVKPSQSQGESMGSEMFKKKRDALDYDAENVDGDFTRGDVVDIGEDIMTHDNRGKEFEKGAAQANVSSEWEDYDPALWEQPEAIETLQGSSSTEEESFIQVKRRKRAQVLTDSPTQSQAAPRAVSSPVMTKKRNLVMSDEVDDELETPIRMPARKKTSVPKPFDSYLEDDDDDDDFIDSRKPARKSSSDDQWKWKKNDTAKAKVNKKTKTAGARGGRGFIEAEAERSGEEHGSDESEDSDYDRYDDSFVCDATQANSQAVAPEDMRAIYLRSLTSRDSENDEAGGRAEHRFQLRDDHAALDVFSQVPGGELSMDYEEDSFCVGDDYQDTEPVETSEVTLLGTTALLDTTTAAAAGPRPRTRYARKKAQLASLYRTVRSVDPPRTGTGSEEDRTKPTRRRRIRKIASSSSSSSSDEDSGTRRPKKRASSSPTSSDDDIEMKKPIQNKAPISYSSNDEDPQMKRRTIKKIASTSYSSIDEEVQTKKSPPIQKAAPMLISSDDDGDDTTDDDKSTRNKITGSRSRKHKSNPVTDSDLEIQEDKTSMKSQKSQNQEASQGFTQLPSLQSRVKARLGGDTKLDIARKTSSSSLNLTDKGLNSSNTNKRKLRRNTDSACQEQPEKLGMLEDGETLRIVTSKVTALSKPSMVGKEDQSRKSDNEAVFSLGFEFDDELNESIVAGFQGSCFDSTNHDQNLENLKSNTNPIRANSTRIDSVQSPEFKDPNVHVSVGKRAATSKASASGVSPPTMSREERLRLCRQRQEEFKRKHAVTSNESVAIGSFSSPSPAPLQPELTIIEDADETLAPAPKSLPPGPVILIDSREIGGAPDIVSALRFRHRAHALVRSLNSGTGVSGGGGGASGCDYVVSERMGVVRLQLGTFTNGAHRARLLERLRALLALFPRPCLIVERGRHDKNTMLFKSKYVEAMVAALSQTHIRTYYSNSQAQSAQILYELSVLERRKKFHIRVPVELSTEQESVLKFYLSMPRVSYVTALNLLHGFPTVRRFINSSVKELEERGRVTAIQARELHRFVQHKFDLQMVGHKR